MSIQETLKYIMVKALDLSKNEKAVLAELERYRMARNASKIARAAGEPRTTAIYILHKFLKWKIVKMIVQEKHTLWMYNNFMNFTGRLSK